MMKNREGISRMGCRLIALAGLVVALGLGMHPTQAWAVDCTAVLSAGDPGPNGPDFDGDGFTDFQECSFIDLAPSLLRVPSCVASINNPNPPADRNACLHPETKDVFVVYAPAPGGLLSGVPFPFDPSGTVTAYGITFNGLSALGVTVHQLAPGQIGLDRIVTTVSPQKAVRVAESLDTSSTILGNCQWGTPNGLDGCVVFTQRTKNFIASTCGSSTIQTPGGVGSDADNVLRAYSTYLILHETGHSLGGLTADYNSRFGGYHYKPGAGLVMEQAVIYSVKGGKCTFYISPVWNALDAPAVKLK